LRRRARQSIIIALGLALGIGLVITVTALSAGVKDAQSSVLHSLYGLDTDITVTQAPTFGSGGARGFGFQGGFGNGQNGRPKAGTKVTIDNLSSTGLGTIAAAAVTSVAKMHNVAAAAGGLTLSDTKLTLTIPNFSGNGGFSPGSGGNPGGGTFRGNTSIPSPVSVDGTDLAGNAAALGPLSTARLSAGRTLSAADTNASVALLDANYARSSKLKVGSSVTLAKTKFSVVGIVSQPASGNPPDVYIPLARAQALGTAQGKSLKGDVNTIYVAADSAASITTVSREISGTMPKATVTNSSDLASQLTGSLSSASSLASNLGKWLAIAVLIAAFLLASLLTGSAVTRRVREFGTLKALGWTSRRIVGQVVGEALVIGVVGGIIGVGLGFLGSTLVSQFSPPLTAAVGPATGTATPGGARQFGGGFPGGGAPGSGNTGFAGRFSALRDAATHNVSVHLSAPVTIGAIVAAVVLAIAGGLIAGSFGGWRAARLRPAMALSRVE